VKRRRGSALYHVLVWAVVVSAFSTAWYAAFGSATARMGRGLERARARAAAEAAWVRARGALERGETPRGGRVLDAETSVVSRRLPDGTLDLAIEARVPRGRETVAHRLELVLAKGSLAVLERREAP